MDGKFIFNMDRCFFHKLILITAYVLLFCCASNTYAKDSNYTHHAFDISVEQERPLEIKLHYVDKNKLQKNQTFAINIPIPPGLIGDLENINISNATGKDLEFHASPLIWWKDIHQNKNKSIRSLRVFIKIPEKNSLPDVVYLHHNRPASKFLHSKPKDTLEWRDKIINLNNGNESRSITIKEPLVYAALPPKWLGMCLLRTATIPLNANKKLAWFDTSFINYSKSVAYNLKKTKPIHQNVSLLDHEPWMFDLPATLFNAYIITGDIKWLIEAHEKTQIFSKFIDEDGQFNIKKKRNLKHSYNLSMLIDLILTGDTDLIPIIENVAAYTKIWHENYTAKTTFWTERHQTYSLLGSLSAWEATGEKSYAERAIVVAHSTINQAKNPLPPWEAQGCVLHTIRSHEGDADDRPVCSPWMSALLSDAMLRFYIHSGEKEALKYIYDLANFITNYGTYVEMKSRHMKGMHLPWYLASKNVGYSDNGPWGDREHTCDVSGLLAKGFWAGNQLNLPVKNIRKKISSLLDVCEKTLNMRYSKSKLSGNKFWKASPPRKYNWWFGTTSDMSYFLQE